MAAGLREELEFTLAWQNLDSGKKPNIKMLLNGYPSDGRHTLFYDRLVGIENGAKKLGVRRYDLIRVENSRYGLYAGYNPVAAGSVNEKGLEETTVAGYSLYFSVTTEGGLLAPE